MQTDTPTRNELLRAVDAEARYWNALVALVGEERMERPGVNGEWTFKDMVAHLNGWRRWTVARLAAPAMQPPPYPCPAAVSDHEDGATDAINAWFYQTARDHPPADVLAESRTQFEAMRAVVTGRPENELYDPHALPWMDGYALWVVLPYSFIHLHVDHEPDIRAWLAREGVDTASLPPPPPFFGVSEE